MTATVVFSLLMLNKLTLPVAPMLIKFSKLNLKRLLLSAVLIGPNAYADHLGISYNPEFPMAKFPYARSSGKCLNWQSPEHIGDYWGPVDFRAACTSHDHCFHRVGASFSACNKEFEENLKQSCERDLKRAKLDSGQLGEVEAKTMKLCLDITNIFHMQVQSNETLEIFHNSQRRQKNYLRFVASKISTLYKNFLNRLPNKDEVFAEFDKLNSGYTLDDLRTSLSGQQVQVESVNLAPVD